MPNLNGDWFHSRSSSNLTELLTVRSILNESYKPKYKSMNWSAGRQGNTTLYELSQSVDIKPSTMQTKIRAMIRYGFIKDKRECPLEWTNMGKLWEELYTVGNLVAADEIYRLTLTVSLATIAFTDKSYTLNPSDGELPLKFLFSKLDARNSILLEELEQLIDGGTERIGNNTSYWLTDLVNTGLFEFSKNRLYYTGKFEELVNGVKTFVPDSSITTEQWNEIRQNPLVNISPFRNAIRNILEDLSNSHNFENDEETDPIVEIIAEQQEISISEDDILSNDTKFAYSIKRIRNATWSKRVKKRFDYRCAIPQCDVVGEVFLEAAHIKPDSAPEEDTPHRTHILNGLSLCRHCHVLFDKGYFTLTYDCRIQVSSQILYLPEQMAVIKIVNSDNEKMKPSIDNRKPLREFINYHRGQKFKG